MVRRQSDNENDREARRKRSFLEEGANVSLVPVFEYAPVTARLAVPRPVTVPLADTADIVERLAGDRDTDAVVTVEFGHLLTPPDFSVVVYLDTPDADAEVGAGERAGFLGTVAFFLHTGEQHDHEPVRVRLPARRAIERTDSSGPISVTCVPLPTTGRRITGGDLDVTVSVELVRSEIN